MDLPCRVIGKSIGGGKRFGLSMSSSLCNCQPDALAGRAEGATRSELASKLHVKESRSVLFGPAFPLCRKEESKQERARDEKHHQQTSGRKQTM